MYQYLVGIYKCCKLLFPYNAMVPSYIIPVGVSVSGWYKQMLQIILFPMQWNDIPINVSFITIHETGSSSAKIIKKCICKESLKHLSSIC